MQAEDSWKVAREAFGKMEFLGALILKTPMNLALSLLVYFLWFFLMLFLITGGWSNGEILKISCFVMLMQSEVQALRWPCKLYTIVL